MGKIVVEHLSKTYTSPGMPRFQALDDVSFEWHSGECLALIGESGSGKSTIGRILIGLERPTTGSVCMDGEHMETWNERTWRSHRSRIQAVFQDATGTLNPRMSVRRNAQITLSNLTSLNRAEREQRIEDLMSLISLNERLLNTPVSALSGGEQRRIALVRAMSIYPEYLILDEVTSGLDSVNSRRVVDAIRVCLSTYHCACLLISHDMRVVDQLANRVIEVSHGKLIRTASR